MGSLDERLHVLPVETAAAVTERSTQEGGPPSLACAGVATANKKGSSKNSDRGNIIMPTG